MTTIVHDQRPVKAQSPLRHTDATETISRLRIALAASIADRASLVERNIVLYERSKHWFVGDDNWAYCLACNLPAKNARHVKRADA